LLLLSNASSLEGVAHLLIVKNHEGGVGCKVRIIKSKRNGEETIHQRSILQHSVLAYKTRNLISTLVAEAFVKLVWPKSVYSTYNDF
jgi:hypothetical protein